MRNTLLFISPLVIMFISCQADNNQDMNADILLHNAYVYPVIGQAIENGAVALKDGRIMALGTSPDLMKDWVSDSTLLVDCQGKFLMPGFIEGHGHFSGLGYNLIQLDLLETQNWQEILDSVEARVKTAAPGDWIVGRGWHQEKWNIPLNPNVNGYPYHDALSRVSPNNPVMLKHASGHSLIANKAAMDAARVSRETPDPAGGYIVRDHQKNVLGVFEENAMDLIEAAYAHYQATLSENDRHRIWLQAIQKVQDHCISLGITSFQDMGSSVDEIKNYKRLAEKDSMNIRLYAFFRDSIEKMQNYVNELPIIHAGEDRFTCRGIKAYMDGALGSYGAWLLDDYEDRPGTTGQMVTPEKEIKQLATLCIENDLQYAVHAIGDRANRTVLDIFEESFTSHSDKKDLRWRIEHAQHIDPADHPRFKQLGVIASMQAIHCTSDAPFVVKRLGEERARTGAYPWRSLLDQGAYLANGTDAPVERADPIPNFYASVTRRRLDSGMEFFKEQAMSREEALYSLTLANAYAAFEEDIKGSIEPGKWGDLVLLSENILTCPEERIPGTKVLMTLVGGEILYQRGD